MDKTVYSATGRRKASVARVRVMPGEGKFVINGKQILAYLTRETLVDHAQEPLLATETMGNFDVICSTRGGGISGQAGAIRLAVSRALCQFNEDFRPALRRAGLLMRDAREVERKKYGQPKARKRFQYSKR